MQSTPCFSNLRKKMKGNGCNILMALIMLLIINRWQQDQQWVSYHTFCSAVLLLQGVLLWMFSHESAFVLSCESSFRPKTDPGTFMVLLVPVIILSEIIACNSSSEREILMKELWLSLVSVSAAIARLMISVKYRVGLFGLVVIVIIGVTLSATLGWMSILSVIEFCAIWKGLEVIPYHLPSSFTFGELATALQLLFTWITRIILNLLQTSSMAKELSELLLTVNTVVIAIVAATLLVYLTGSYASIWHFLAVYVIMAVLCLTFLHVYFGGNPLMWLLNFVLGSCVKIFLLTSWILLFLVTVIWTVREGLIIQSRRERKLLMKAKGHDLSEEKGVDPTTRKVFHGFIVLVYIPGLLWDPHLLLLASSAAFGIFIILEAARALHVPCIGEQLDMVLRTFIDDKDQGEIFLTHIYLLLGLSLPLWISHRLISVNSATLEMYSGVLSLGIGDTIACVAGRAVGRITWPGCNKTVEGTLFSIASQMILVWLGTCSGYITVDSLLTVFIGVVLAALVEAFTDQIDNLVLPLVLYPFLCVQ